MITAFKSLIFGIAATMGMFRINDSTFIEKKFDPYNLDPRYKVQKISTPLDQKQIAEVLCESHTQEFGRPPSRNRLALSWAQVALENNRGKKVWNNNLGNQGPFRMDQEYYHHLRRGWPYRSFRTAADGGRAYWQVIRKCSVALQYFDVGDPATAASALKSCNYYSSSTDNYSRVMSSLYYEAMTRVLPDVKCGSD